MEMKDITMSELGALKSALHFTSAGKLKQNEKQVQGASAVWDDLAKKDWLRKWIDSKPVFMKYQMKRLTCLLKITLVEKGGNDMKKPSTITEPNWSSGDICEWHIPDMGRPEPDAMIRYVSAVEYRNGSFNLSGYLFPNVRLIKVLGNIYENSELLEAEK